jgi:hypothetical protein
MRLSATTAPRVIFRHPPLALAARGIETLVRNNGKMRLLVGCTLDPAETDAIAAGYDMRETVAGRLMKMPLLAGDADHREALELLSWMVAKGLLDVKVAIPKNEAGKPIPEFSPVPRKVRSDRGQDRRPHCVFRQHQRDGRRLEAELGKLPCVLLLGRRRCPHTGRGRQLCAPLGRPLAARLGDGYTRRHRKGIASLPSRRGRRTVAGAKTG